MMRKTICSLLFSLIFVAPSFSQVAIPYGEGSGKVDYMNQKKLPGSSDPVGDGPASFRIVNNKFIIADSVGGKIIFADENGKIKAELPILKKGDKPVSNAPLKILIEDIAPVLGDFGVINGVWVADGMRQTVTRYDMKGNAVKTISNPEFGQINTIEYGIGGHLFVSDMVKRRIFVYDTEGKFERSFNWEWSGFAVSGSNDDLHRLMYVREINKSMLVTTDLNNKILREVSLNLPNHMNPRLWWVDDVKEECVISYIPVSMIGKMGNVSEIMIARVGYNGKIKESKAFKRPIAMINRFIAHADYEKIFVADANYNEAPNGQFKIVPFSFETKKKKK